MSNASPFDTSMKWAAMSIVQKLVFCGKFVIGLCTFGFVFPHLFD
jgi:hypothetical protein